MEIFDALEAIAISHPRLFVFAILLITLLPKVFEYLTKSKKIYFESQNSVYESLAARLNEVHERCGNLEKEIENWKSKFFQLKEKLHKLEMENSNLKQDLNLLRASRS